MKRLLRYLKGTMDYSLKLKPSGSVLQAHADADWVGSPDRKSITGNIILLGGSLVFWKSAKQ